MSHNVVNLFPISVYHGKVSHNEKLKNLILPYIESVKNHLPSAPPDWFTNRMITSYGDDEISSIFYDGGIISEESQKQYTEVIQSFFKHHVQFEVVSTWFNYYDNGEYQEAHSHMGGPFTPIHFSCVHFLSYDSELHSPLTFVDPLLTLRSVALELNDYSEKYSCSVKEGDFLMFPCYLDHEVSPSLPTPGNPRVTVTLNIKVNEYDIDNFI